MPGEDIQIDGYADGSETPTVLYAIWGESTAQAAENSTEPTAADSEEPAVANYTQPQTTDPLEPAVADPTDLAPTVPDAASGSDGTLPTEGGLDG